jgi:hypothetical protein
MPLSANSVIIHQVIAAGTEPGWISDLLLSSNERAVVPYGIAHDILPDHGRRRAIGDAAGEALARFRNPVEQVAVVAGRRVLCRGEDNPGGIGFEGAFDRYLRVVWKRIIKTRGGGFAFRGAKGAPGIATFEACGLRATGLGSGGGDVVGTGTDVGGSRGNFEMEIPGGCLAPRH